MNEDEAKRTWLVPEPARVVVAVDGDNVLGTANMYANKPGPGSHVASGSLMVADAARGRGVGRSLATDMIDWARSNGFVAIQFNAVVETNKSAIHLYESLGFVTLGIAPGAFRHPVNGDVDLRIMWLDLKQDRPLPIVRGLRLIGRRCQHPGGRTAAAHPVSARCR